MINMIVLFYSLILVFLRGLAIFRHSECSLFIFLIIKVDIHYDRPIFVFRRMHLIFSVMRFLAELDLVFKVKQYLQCIWNDYLTQLMKLIYSAFYDSPFRLFNIIMELLPIFDFYLHFPFIFPFIFLHFFLVLIDLFLICFEITMVLFSFDKIHFTNK